MAYRLAVEKVQAITGLHAAGLSDRQIAETLSVSRKAVRRHLGRLGAKDTKAPTGCEDLPSGLAAAPPWACAGGRLPRCGEGPVIAMSVRLDVAFSYLRERPRGAARSGK